MELFRLAYFFLNSHCRQYQQIANLNTISNIAQNQTNRYNSFYNSIYSLDIATSPTKVVLNFPGASNAISVKALNCLVINILI